MYVITVSVKNDIVSVKYISTYFNHKISVYVKYICINTKTKTNQNKYNAKLGLNN